MANILDYLDEKKDVSFREEPFNEVDNLVLCALAYTDFDGVLPGPGILKKVPIARAAALFFEKHSEAEILAKNTFTRESPFVLKKMALSRRFQRVKLCGYTNECDADSEMQFSCVTLLLPDHTWFVAFRGTDNSLLGWKEDFNMSYLYQTAGQIRAASYVSENFRFTFRKIRLGGHSKGGNFAIYAGAFADPKVKRKIVEIWSNDGPGFRKRITMRPEYQEVLPKVHSIIPELSMIGMIMENDLDHKIVKSSQNGVYQHDAFSWQVQGFHFAEAENRGDRSIFFDTTLQKWLDGVDDENRKIFVDVLFQAMFDTGATTMSELKKSRSQTLKGMLQAVSQYPIEKQKVFFELLAKLALSSGETFFSELLQNIPKTFFLK